jgi:hypothetical protein
VILHVIGQIGYERPDRVEFEWRALIKHTDDELCTGRIPEAFLREVLAGVPVS